jgi:IS605 OrfB family transposase
LITFKYRLYPNKEQTAKLEWTLARCCELYNAALEERRDAVKRVYPMKQFGNVMAIRVKEIDGKRGNHGEKPRGLVVAEHETHVLRKVDKSEQSRELTEIKREIREEYQQINDHILRNVLDRLDKAFDAFFRRCKAGETPGYPRIRGKGRYDSFCSDSGFKLNGDRLILQNIGSIKAKLHRQVEGKIKTCTIKREGTHWYACFACEVEPQPKLPYTDEMVGIDVGLHHFAALSTGDMIENPRYLRKAEKKLKKAQEALSRKKPKSKRRKKAVQRVVAHHRKVRNRRKDFLHKESRSLVDTYETIVFEDLQTKNLVRRPKPKQDEDGNYLPNGASAKAGTNKSISDAGWSMFTQMVAYKAEWAGTHVIFVNPFKTSQRCSACHEEGPHKDLDERTHTCIHCGVVLDRDHNAALNILQLGYKSREDMVRSP